MELQQAQQNSGWSGGQGAGAPSLDRRSNNGWRQSERMNGSDAPLAKALGWFSLGLGLAQIAAPERVARWVGVGEDDDNLAVMRTVGLREIASGFLLGAERVIAIDRLPYRLQMAREKAGAETINYEEVDVLDTLREMTGGRGPDACIDAVGCEGHAPGFHGAYDYAKQSVRLATDRPPSLREAILACRNGGTVSVPACMADSWTRSRLAPP